MELSDEMQAQAKALADPSRFEIFRHISGATEDVTVAGLTSLMGFNHNAIRQHLAVLVDTGLVTALEERRTTRGRPRKLYRPRADALAAFGPISGSYERLAELLLELATGSASPYEVGFDAASKAKPRPEMTEVDGLVAELAADGFEPRRSPDGSIVLGNCPFAEIAAKRPGVICELHRGLIDGHLAQRDAGSKGTLTIKDPKQAGCRVAIHHGTEP